MAGPGAIGVRIRQAAEIPFLLCHGRRRPVARPDGSHQAEASEGKAHVPCHGRRGPGYDMGGSEFIQSEPAASRTLMRKQERFYADSRRCTPSTQMAENASQAVPNALDLEARIAGVYCSLCCSGFQRNSKEWKQRILHVNYGAALFDDKHWENIIAPPPFARHHVFACRLLRRRTSSVRHAAMATAASPQCCPRRRR